MEMKKYLLYKIIEHLDNIIIVNLMWSAQVPSEYGSVVSVGENYPGINEDLSILNHVDYDAPVQNMDMMVTDLQNHQHLSDSNPVSNMSKKQVNHLDKKVLHVINTFAGYAKISTKDLKKNLVCLSYIETQKKLKRFKDDLPAKNKNRNDKKKSYIKLLTDEATSIDYLPVNKSKAKLALTQYVDNNFKRVDDDLSAKFNRSMASNISDICDKRLGVIAVIEKVLLHHHIITHKQIDNALDKQISNM